MSVSHCRSHKYQRGKKVICHHRINNVLKTSPDLSHLDCVRPSPERCNLLTKFLSNICKYRVGRDRVNSD